MALVGHNIRFTKDEIEAMLLKKAHDVAVARGISRFTPEEFAMRAAAHYELVGGETTIGAEHVSLESVSVTWTE